MKQNENNDPLLTDAQDLEKKKRENWMHMMRAYTPRTHDGHLVPVTFFDGQPQIYLYPVQKLDKNGKFHPMDFAEDFADGKIPDYIGYEPGYELNPASLGKPPYADTVQFLNPEYNLSVYDRSLLWQVRNQSKVPPMKVIVSNPNQPTEAVDKVADPNVMAIDKVVDSQVVADDVIVMNTESGMICRTPKGDYSLANFSIEAVEKRYVHTGYHEKDISIEYEIMVTVKRISRNFVISPKHINRVTDIIQAVLPECTVNVGISKANALIANHVRNQLTSLQECHYIKVTGFFKILGKWVFAHDAAHFKESNVVFQTGRTIAADLRFNPKGAFAFAMNFLAITSNLALSLMLLLFAHLSPMFNLFVEAGFTPRFVLFLNGRSGSMKTSISLVAFRLFKEQPNSAESNFKDTEAAMEIKLGEAYGHVLLVDDFRPRIDTGDGKSIKVKLESIVRATGDRIAKSRSNPELGKAKEFLPTGLPAVTAEDLGGTQSSQLRMLIVPIRQGDVDGRQLKVFQDNPELLTTHMFYFLQWVGEHGDEIISGIQSEIEKERSYFENSLKERRVVDTGVTLMLTAKILHAYGCFVNGFPKGTEMQKLHEWRQAILQAVIESEGASKAQNPVSMYLQAFFDMLDREEISLARDAKSYDAIQHLGYINGENLWVWPKHIYSMVVKYWQKLGLLFPISCDKVSEHLESAGLIRVDYERRGDGMKKLYVHKSALPNRNRLMVLNEPLARQFLEKESN